MIKAFSFKPYDDDLLVDYLKEYTNKNVCCSKYPNCTHPKKQSDAYVFDDDNKTVQYLKEQYHKILKDLFGPRKIKLSKAWILHVNKKEKTPAIWHKHSENQYKNNIQVSGICYLTPTTIGTEFDSTFFTMQIKPMGYTWYLWDSNNLHRPMEGLQKTDRLILATQTVLN
tara:strand:+ start:3123 stop:3632 length:510 start_codon:yes stop_codon:yes gene_type:complete